MENIVYSRISQLCREKEISINKLEKDLGFGASSINKWYRSKPSADKVKAVADYFGVSMDYLYGRTDIQDVADDLIEGDLISLQRARQNMSPEDWGRAMKIFRAGFEDAFKDK